MDDFHSEMTRLYIAFHTGRNGEERRHAIMQMLTLNAAASEMPQDYRDFYSNLIYGQLAKMSGNQTSMYVV